MQETGFSRQNPICLDFKNLPTLILATHKAASKPAFQLIKFTSNSLGETHEEDSSSCSSNNGCFCCR